MYTITGYYWDNRVSTTTTTSFYKSTVPKYVYTPKNLIDNIKCEFCGKTGAVLHKNIKSMCTCKNCGKTIKNPLLQ